MAVPGCVESRPPENVLQVAWPAPIADFRPNAGSEASLVDFAGLVYDGLVGVLPGGELTAGLAERWSTADNRTFRFHLRHGVRFHDGTPFTATEAAAAWLAALESPPGGATYPWQLGLIRGAADHGAGGDIPGLRVVDDSTLDVELVQPFAPFPATLTQPSVAIAGPGSTGTRPVGTGPWRLVAGRPGDSTYTLARNPDYFGGPAGFDSLRLRVIEPQALGRALDLGRIDCVPYASPSQDVALRPDVSISISPAENHLVVLLNHRNGFLADVRVRRALQMALDVDRLPAAPRGSVRVPSALPPEMAAPEPGRAVWPFDPVHARALLDSAGVPPGTRFRFGSDAPPGSPRHRQVQWIRDHLAAVGIVTDVVPLSLGEGAMHGNRIDLELTGWIPDYPDPDALLYPLYHSSGASGLANAWAFADPTVDVAIDAQRVAPDGPERVSRLRHAGGLLYDLLPSLFLRFEPVMTLSSGRVDRCPSSLFRSTYTRIRPRHR